MQPYFFPHLPYFALIANTDAWVVFDSTQYTPKSWMNRNRILRSDKGWMYITVPLRHSTRNMAIHEAQILDAGRTHRSVSGKLSHYRRRAPFFEQVQELVDRTFDELTEASLVQLNVNGLRVTCEYLGIPFSYRIASQMRLSLPPVTHAGGWAPAIARSLGADEYVNPIGGQALFDPTEFAEAGVVPKFLDMPPFVYRTAGYEFEPGLSILDVLMWNEPTVVVRAFETATVITGR